MTFAKLDNYEIALLQLDLKLGDAAGNLQKAEQKIREAASHGAKLICLPEAFNTGYDGRHIPDMKAAAEPVDGPSLTKIRQLAKELQIYILAPIICAAGSAVENRAFLAAADGQIVGSYAKTHPVGDEQKNFQRGTEYPVWDTPLGKIGIVICYDVCFPETVRMLALQGAELVLVPAAWRATSYFCHWWDLNIQCRALDNLLYIAAVNRTGRCGEEEFAGKSQLVSPIGDVIDTCGIRTESILYGTIDLSRIAKERAFNTVFQDRHREDYRMICEK